MFFAFAEGNGRTAVSTWVAFALSACVACGGSTNGSELDDRDAPPMDNVSNRPDNASAVETEAPDASVTPPPSQGAEPRKVTRCIGTPASCSGYASQTSCEAQGCDWAICSGSPTNCWDGTDAGSNIGLCAQLKPYCQVVNNSIVGRVCQSAQSFSVKVPCSAFEDVDYPRSSCVSAGCAWNDTPSCVGTPPACDTLDATQCMAAPGCRTIVQNEAPCEDPTGDGCACPKGFALCGATCVDTLTSSANCGACGKVCAADEQCAGGSCVDVDECASGTAKCPKHSTCRNTPHGFACDCETGYDGGACTDVNECASPNDCSPDSTCQNTDGGYTCKCREGFSGDGKVCRDEDECQTTNCGPHGSCANQIGSYECKCAAGYSWPRAGECILSDGCAAAGLSCSARATCQLREGNYLCVCDQGFEGDGETCTDIDECTVAPGTCGANSVCTNVPGSRECSCLPGYGPVGSESCAVVDECVAGHACASAEQCSHGSNGFVCQCLNGQSATTSCATWLDAESARSQNGYLLNKTIAGYWFTAPFDFRIVAVSAPNRPSDFVGTKNVTVYLINEIGVQTNAFSILGGGAVTASEMRVVDIAVKQGQRIGVIARNTPTDPYVLGQSLLSFVGGAYRSSMGGQGIVLKPLEAVYSGLAFKGLFAWDDEPGTFHRGHAEIMWMMPKP